MSSEPKPASEPSIDEDDVDDVIGHAERLKLGEEGKLSLDDLKAVGRELDIEERHVEQAVHKLEGERREQHARLARLTAQRRKLLRYVGIAFAVLFVLLASITVSARSTLNDGLAEVRAKRAQLDSVLERQARVKALYVGRAATLDSDAELLGAENRVRVEQKRYDEAAARYNAEARGFGAGLATSLFGLPESVPLSNAGR